MNRTGCAELPLHSGRCPRWLFPRMVRLGGEISRFIIFEYGRSEFLRRISDPYFFQCLGSVLGFDWHSSGLTTTVCAALKEALTPEDGVLVLGGKGSASRGTPSEIIEASESFGMGSSRAEELQRASRLIAKVDNALVQDGFQLYHHSFFLAEDGSYAVVQQGMSQASQYARRYHWLSGFESFVEEPHSAIFSYTLKQDVLNMTSRESRAARKCSVDLACDGPGRIVRMLNSCCSEQRSLLEYSQFKSLSMPRMHTIPRMGKRDFETLKAAYELQPETYEELISVRGFGAKAVRALALISELIYGCGASWDDPARFSFAHGGKDGIPYPVDTALMDENVSVLRDAIRDAQVGDFDKRRALMRLKNLYSLTR
ncbi:MAG: DUF763 domain-containing protein [Candidatus Woesearchaeota archaeon]